MIKVNVEINNKSWHKKIRYPKKYFNKKLNKIFRNIKLFKNKDLSFTILLTNSVKMKRLNNLLRLFTFYKRPQTKRIYWHIKRK